MNCTTVRIHFLSDVYADVTVVLRELPLDILLGCPCGGLAPHLGGGSREEL